MRMDVGDTTGTGLAFRPEVFFLRPWTGMGLARGPTGKITGRFTADGHGRIDSADGSAVVHQSFRNTDGQETGLTWRIVEDEQGRFAATEQASGVQAKGGPQGPDFRWIFEAPTLTPFGRLKVRFEVTYTLVNAEEAMSYTRLTRWGIPLGSLTAYYRHR